VYQGSGTSYTSSGLAYSTSYTLRVVAVNSEGLTGEAQRSATSGPNPARVTISKGSPRFVSTCTDASCAYVRVELVGIPLPATVSCREPNDAQWWTYTARSQVTEVCIWGFPGQTISVVVNGIRSNGLTWFR
jgi:hypothetical protein